MPKIKVNIYYETLNLATRNYINRQIAPFYHIIEDMVELDLIPYGNTQYDNSDGNHNFTCSSGDDQCIANRIQVSQYSLLKDFCFYIQKRLNEFYYLRQ